MSENVKKASIAAVAERLNQIVELDEYGPEPKRMIAEQIVDLVLGAFGVSHEHVVEQSGTKNDADGYDRLTVSAKPDSAVRVVADDNASSLRLTNNPGDVLVDLVFHRFGDRISTTTVYLRPRASLSPSVPTVAYRETRPSLLRMG